MSPLSVRVRPRAQRSLTTHRKEKSRNLRRRRQSRKYLLRGQFPHESPYKAYGCSYRHSDRRRPAAPSPGKGASAGSAGPAQTGVDSSQGTGLGGLPGHTAYRAREWPAYRLRGSWLPQYRRVLGAKARHLHDHGRHLYAGLRLLQRQDRAARPARSGRAGTRRRGDPQARSRAHRRHLGRPRRSQ